MNLKLTRPIVFFDLETTGLDIFNDRIVEFAAIKLWPDGKKEEFEWLVNPGMAIPKGASAIHGITDDQVKEAPRLGDLAEELASIFAESDLGGYNIKNYDLPLLREEFNRIGLPIDTEHLAIVDAMAIFKAKEPRTLSVAYQKYCGKTLEDAHSAMVDIAATVEVLEGQLGMYEDIPREASEIHDFCFPKDPDAYDAEGKLRFLDGQLTINFGKNRGKKLQALAAQDPGYLEWILNGSFSDKVKQAVREALQ